MPRKSLIGSNEMLAWALGGLEREIAQTRERLAVLGTQAARIRAKLSRKPMPAPGEADVPPRKRKVMSRAARKRISEAMKKRWAERKRQPKK